MNIFQASFLVQWGGVQISKAGRVLNGKTRILSASAWNEKAERW
jgi:hypothetical protein